MTMTLTTYSDWSVLNPATGACTVFLTLTLPSGSYKFAVT